MELYHHGIKGQKWGVRRYQYADGTYTPAGRKRYGVSRNDSRMERMADKFTRNEIMTPNEFRQVIGMKPSKDPKSDQLANRNIASADEGMPIQGEETYADEQGYDYADQQEGV